MGAARPIAFRLEKAEVIARLDLQRANIADTWREVSEPLQAFDDGIRNFSRYSKTFGGIAVVAGIGLLASGRLHLFRKALKIALFAIPYIISHRSSGVLGLICTLLKKIAGRFF